jgi:glycosyltransferase involved in cell wall biosynthesis
MVGMLHVPARVGNELRQYVEVVGAVPRDQVCGHLQWADVFLLPSICEGSATVVYEALASGLPVICTPNTGSVVRHGTDGWIVPAGDTCCIVECLRRLATDKELLAYQARNARQRATEFDLARYGHRLVQLIDEALGQKRSH